MHDFPPSRFHQNQVESQQVSDAGARYTPATHSGHLTRVAHIHGTHHMAHAVQDRASPDKDMGLGRVAT